MKSMGIRNKLVLDDDTKILIEIYRVFYNENPNFSDSNINIKIQTMLSILAAFGISINDEYSFRLLEKDEMPTSLYLTLRVNELFPLGEVTETDESINLSKKSKEIIRIVGKEIRESIGDNPNKNQMLMSISKTIYAGRYCLFSYDNRKEISRITGENTNEIESNIKLVRELRKKLEKKASEEK